MSDAVFNNLLLGFVIVAGFVALVFAILIGRQVMRMRRHDRNLDRGNCPHCGYPLRFNGVEHWCSECGYRHPVKK